MSDLTEWQEDEVRFISGLDRNGVIVDDTYYTYNLKSIFPDDSRVSISKWFNDGTGTPIAPTSKAGTPGGVVKYAFDGSVGEQGKAGYEAALTLWSDIADIKFAKVSMSDNPNLKIYNTDQLNGYSFIPHNKFIDATAGVSDLPTQMAPNTRGGPNRVDLNAEDWTFNFMTDNLSIEGTVVHELGHMIGLGHAGPYNGSVQSEARTPYDNRLFTTMSYKPAGDESEKFKGQYPVQGSWWGSKKSNGDWLWGDSQTPMMLDILAAQRLYGASKSTTFAGGQTYGFNTNIADSAKRFYDFSINKEPIVTIYNSGVNNTLDVSGFEWNSRINLNPGTFSSASADGSLANNIAIALDTRIDTAIGGAGNDTFILNGHGDTIDGGGGKNKVVIQDDKSKFIVKKIDESHTTIINKVTGATDALTNIQDIEFAAPLCFTTGTRIRLLRDNAAIDVAVEDLRVGDMAVTASGTHRPVTWIGRRSLGSAARLMPADQAPVRVRAGAFGPGLPARDLLLSPGHPVLVGAEADGTGGVLVPVMCLLNGTSIAREAVAAVTYWHVELDQHDILLAEGLPAESFLDFGCRPFFEEGSTHALHHPDFVPPGLAGRCRPVATDGPCVEAERRRLEAVFAESLTSACAWSGSEEAWLVM